MTSYEVMYLLAPNLEEEAYPAFQEKVTDLISAEGGQVEKVDTWGKRRLAYEIQKFREAFYTVVYFQGSAELVNELDRVLKINETVIRHLIVRHEEKVTVKPGRKVAAQNAQ